MAKGPLVDSLTAAGRSLVELLDAARVDIRSALWLYRPESEDWVLVLALPEARTKGPRAAYKRIHNTYMAHRQKLLPLKVDDIVVMVPNDPFLRLLGRAVRTGRSLSEIRFTHNRIGDTLVDDALIYRLQAS